MTNNSIPVYKEKNLRIIFLITLMAVLGVASITPAFPKIAKELSISAHSIGLLIIFFTFPGIILTPVMGVLADRYGRKKVIIPSLLLFGIAGTACAFTRNFEMLLLLRFFQGVGAASLGSLNITLIGDIYKEKKRAEAMGYNSSVLSVATASYPVLGGFLASLAWYYPFLLPAFALPIALIVLSGLENPEPENKQDFKKYIVNFFSCLKNKNAILYFAASLVTFILLYGSYLTYFPFLLSENFEVTPFVIGLMMSIMSVVTAVTSSQLGRLLKHRSSERLLIMSFFLYSSALFIIPFLSSIWLEIIPLIIFGIAHGINIPTTQILLADIAPLEYRGAFMSFNGMVLRLGQTLGPLFIGAMFVWGGQLFAFISGSFLAFSFFILMLFLNRRKN